MVKVVLVRVYETMASFGYGDDPAETFRSIDGLDYEEVEQEELNELREAVRLFNSKATRGGYSLALFVQSPEDDKVRSLADLKSYREKLTRQVEAQEKAQHAARQKAALSRAQSKLKRTAKQLGVSVEALVALQAQQEKKS